MSKLISFALDFSSFLLQKVDTSIIRNVILFGSVARGESNEDSDIDIFVDVIDVKFESKIRKCLTDFLNSVKYEKYWNALGIKNEINLSIGSIEEWKELKPSILSDGICLYGKFKIKADNGELRTNFIWENVTPNSKRVLFNKQLLGYKQNGKIYNGLIQKYNGIKLGKGCISVPIEHSKIFHNLFKKYMIKVKIINVLELS
jgi:predicted nucleotidyltransferase